MAIRSKLHFGGLNRARRTNKGALEARKEGRKGSALATSFHGRTAFNLKLSSVLTSKDQSWYESMDLHLANSSTESGRLRALLRSRQRRNRIPIFRLVRPPSARPSDHPSVRPSFALPAESNRVSACPLPAHLTLTFGVLVGGVNRSSLSNKPL